MRPPKMQRALRAAALAEVELAGTGAGTGTSRERLMAGLREAMESEGGHARRLGEAKGLSSL